MLSDVRKSGNETRQHALHRSSFIYSDNAQTVGVIACFAGRVSGISSLFRLICYFCHVHILFSDCAVHPTTHRVKKCKYGWHLGQRAITHLFVSIVYVWIHYLIRIFRLLLLLVIKCVIWAVQVLLVVCRSFGILGKVHANSTDLFHVTLTSVHSTARFTLLYLSCAVHDIHASSVTIDGSHLTDRPTVNLIIPSLHYNAPGGDAEFQHFTTDPPPGVVSLGVRRSLPPLAFIFTLVVLVLVALLLLLTFWCVHKRTSRRKSQVVVQPKKSSSSVEQAVGSETQDNAVRIISSSPQPEPQQSPVSPPEPCNVPTHWFPHLLACCPPGHTTAQNTGNEQTVHTYTKENFNTDSSILSAKSAGRSPMDTTTSFRSMSVNNAYVSYSEVACSPSLASRRNVAPLPKLMTASILSPHPPIETSLFTVQPIKNACIPQTSEPATTDSVPQLKSNHLFTTSGLSQTDSSELGPSRFHLGPSRTRTKGLLESRRGSHTSLTLSLSPLVDTPATTAYSAGLPSSERGISLDESSGNGADSLLPIICTLDEYCLSARHIPSEKHASSYFVPVISQSPLTVEASASNLTHTSSEECHSMKRNLADPVRSEHGDSMLHRRAHQMLYRRLHCHPTHHRCIETGQPCPHMIQPYQSSRDLEQLMNASQPLSYDQLVHKLHDNASALFQEFWNIPMNHTSKKELPIAGIGQKNRYQSILPNCSTRVVLPMINNDPTTSYINANYIRGYGDRPNAFIATQGPMSHTVVDFWRMVWHCNSPAVVMITKLVEKQGVKCELYLPNTPPEVAVTRLDPIPSCVDGRQYGSLADIPSSRGSESVPYSSPSQSAASPTEDSGIASREDQSVDTAYLKTDSNQSTSLDSCDLVALPTCTQTYGDIRVTVMSLERFEGYSVRQLVLHRNSEERLVSHFWYTAWPDHSSPDTTPASSRQLLRLVKAVESCRRKPGHPVPAPQPVPSQEIKDSNKAALVTSSVGASHSTKSTENDSLAEDVELVSADGPIIVHCSAGLGRTGCFIALCVGCDQLEREGVVDVLRIVSRLRLDRGGMVQTNEQYEFIHHALTAFPSLHSSTVCDLE